MLDQRIPPDTIIRSWATLEIKADGDGEQRLIKGIASTPATDRGGDIVEPLGLQFAKQIPLLYQHRHAEPVGIAKLDKPTGEGVTFSAQLAKIANAGALKSRIDDVWDMLKAGLIRGVSIGFKPLEYSFMDDGGVRFIKSEVVELSLVTIPMNSEATVSMIKSYDVAPAAPGTRLQLQSSGAADTTPKGKPKMQPISEQISAFEARRKAASDRMAELMSKAADSGVTLDQAESDEYDGLEIDVKKIGEHIDRLVKLEAQNKAAAVEVVAKTMAEASQSRQPTIVNRQGEQVIRLKPNCHPTSPFIRYCIALGAAGGDQTRAYQYAKRRVDWHSSTPELLAILESDEAVYKIRAAVPAGTTYDSTWAGPLVYAENLTSAFAEYLRPLTIIGRFASLRRVPFNIRVPRVTSGTSGGWVGEAAPKPITSMALDTIIMTWAKAAAIVVITEELARFSNPAAEDMVRTDLSRSIVQFLDRQFVDPSVAAVTNVSPASITNGVTPITPSGVNMAAFRADVRSLFSSLLDDNQSLAGGYWITTQQQALALSLAQNSLGQTIYPTINAEQGGTLLGYPVIASENIPATGGSPVDGYPLIFAIGPEILLADDGQVTIDVSREASVQMDGAPDSPPTASTNMQSLWQLNQIGIKAERFITWARRRPTAVAWIQNAKYAE
jgi:HK97 family phage major capsid protein/HK97 family phage prohead protease